MHQMQSPQVPRSADGALAIAIDSLGSGLKDSNSVVAHKHATGCDTRKELTVCYPVSNSVESKYTGWVYHPGALQPANRHGGDARGLGRQSCAGRHQ